MNKPAPRSDRGTRLLDVGRYLVETWPACVMPHWRHAGYRTVPAKLLGVPALSSQPPLPILLAHNCSHRICKAEGTEGEAESRILRKLLKNQNRLIDSIRLMDIDRDGVISTAEFRAAVVAMNVGLTARQVDKLIRSIDLDNNGELDMQVSRTFSPRN